MVDIPYHCSQFKPLTLSRTLKKSTFGDKTRPELRVEEEEKGRLGVQDAY